ncbi:MAG: hypothetical protein N3H31_03085 [Candidatus Nezhaarchaeota archaeon]|nr:hypothetical protein [Candidatus Nezhaarchaeota archaeon]
MAHEARSAWVHVSLVQACSYGWWRTLSMIIRTHGPKAFETQEWLEVGRGVGLREGSGLKQSLPLELSGTSLLAEALKNSHWAILEDVEVAASDEEIELKIYGCTARQALAKWGTEGYDCSGFTQAVLEGFTEGLGVKAEVKLLEGPRLAGRKEVSCRWKVKILTASPGLFNGHGPGSR